MKTKTLEVDYADVQGLVRFGYKHMQLASYVLLRVKDAAAARAWLRTASVSNAAASDSRSKTALQVAFTASGLAAFGVSAEVIAGFSREFRSGMTEESRARQLGDMEANAPQYWRWGVSNLEPHLVVMFFGARDDADLHEASFQKFVLEAKGRDWSNAFAEVATLNTQGIGSSEAFGFRDGISQPELDWEQQRVTTWPQYDYSNVVALGEFLLGYPNEYGKLTDRPLLSANHATAGLLAASEAPDKKDLGRNGTYLVIRHLEQDVRKFWQFMDEQSNGDPAAAERLAALMVGRQRNGDPLVPTQSTPIPGIGTKAGQNAQNQFTYEQDPTGSRCPFGSHLRRANPRNTDFPNRPGFFGKILTMLGFGPRGYRDDLMSSVRYHRILRRGRGYGPVLSPIDARYSAPPDDPERGLVFLALNANLSRQFEFLQNAWMKNTKFDGMTGESDPLVGNRLPIPGCPVTSNFNMPADGTLRQRVTGLPQFVTVRGGAYFFLPSLRALRYFAGTN